MNAYHRMDPSMDEKKSHYTPAQLGAFTKIQLIAHRQPQPGRWRSIKHLKAALPAGFAKHVDFLYDEGDLVVEGETGLLYLDGFDEWQFGDLTVAARMRALRERKRHGKVLPDRNSDRNGKGNGNPVSSVPPPPPEPPTPTRVRHLAYGVGANNSETPATTHAYAHEASGLKPNDDGGTEPSPVSRPESPTPPLDSISEFLRNSSSVDPDRRAKLLARISPWDEFPKLLDGALEIVGRGLSSLEVEELASWETRYPRLTAAEMLAQLRKCRTWHIERHRGFKHVKLARDFLHGVNAQACDEGRGLAPRTASIGSLAEQYMARCPALASGSNGESAWH